MFSFYLCTHKEALTHRSLANWADGLPVHVHQPRLHREKTCAVLAFLEQHLRGPARPSSLHIESRTIPTPALRDFGVPPRS
jgi:hypothetical protein